MTKKRNVRSESKGNIHKLTRTSKSIKKVRRPTRKLQKSKHTNKGGGRPKGSTISKVTGLTERQESIAKAMLDAELKSGLFPASVREVVKVTNADPAYVRDLLRRKTFQDYLFKLLEVEGVVLEGAFWRSMALGIQAGDPKVLDLYAKISGKVTAKQEKSISVEINAPTTPDGTKLALPSYEIVDAEVVEDE